MTEDELKTIEAHEKFLDHYSTVEDYVALARTDIPALVAEVRKLKALIDEMGHHEGAEGWSKALYMRIVEALK